jgi:hypothetical protein
MFASRLLTRWFEWCRQSGWARDVAQDWRRWSRTERIAATLLLISPFALMLSALYGL